MTLHDMPKPGWLGTRLMLRFADLSLLLVLWVVVLPPTSFGPDPAPTSLGLTIIGIGLTGLVTGVIWIHRIARGDPEPEAIDRHWWSRA